MSDAMSKRVLATMSHPQMMNLRLVHDGRGAELTSREVHELEDRGLVTRNRAGQVVLTPHGARIHEDIPA